MSKHRKPGKVLNLSVVRRRRELGTESMRQAMGEQRVSILRSVEKFLGSLGQVTARAAELNEKWPCAEALRSHARALELQAEVGELYWRMVREFGDKPL